MIVFMADLLVVRWSILNRSNTGIYYYYYYLNVKINVAWAK